MTEIWILSSFKFNHRDQKQMRDRHVISSIVIAGVYGGTVLSSCAAVLKRDNDQRHGVNKKSKNDMTIQSKEFNVTRIRLIFPSAEGGERDAIDNNDALQE